ncbi:MAG: ribosome maturation factor RimM [Lachnospiraceae bacterium]|nr:ribosome maturation factor RimM [Lachnospiraceae bacterium]
MENLLQVGAVTSTHGLKGEVKVFPTTDDAHRFDALKEVILNTGKEQMTLQIERVRYFKQFVIVKFKEFNDINEVQEYTGFGLFVTRENAQPLAENEYYVADLIGCRVVLEDGTDFGTLTDVMETGANDVYVVETEEKKEVLIPAIHDCILDVDIKNQVIRVHLLEGLL